MPRPRHVRPTPAELEVLKALWAHGPLTVRETLEHLSAGGASTARANAVEAADDGSEAPGAYTSVMSLMNVMAEKGHLTRTLEGRAYRYAPADEPSQVRGDFLRDVWSRVFGESTESLALHLLDVSAPSEDELQAIRDAIDAYRANREAPTAKKNAGQGSEKLPNGRKRPRD